MSDADTNEDTPQPGDGDAAGDAGSDATGPRRDTSWKEQVAREKAKQAEQHGGGEGAGDPRGEAGEGEQRQLPRNFQALCSMLASQAVLYLGGMQHPEGGVIVDLEQARWAIDMLEILKDKTEGNRTDEETSLLERAIYETQMAWVQVRDELERRAAAGETGGPPTPPAPDSGPSDQAGDEGDKDGPSIIVP